jgi:N,N'-diacetylchitobiose phosphorylase
MRYGYFDDQNQEYVIERPDVPVSWTNYLGVKDFCTVISHNAGGYSFYKSAEHQRITRFRQNGVPLDRPGHYLYLRDDQDGDFWSVSWQPVGKRLPPLNLPQIQESAGLGGGEEGEGKYEVRHGLSYSKLLCEYKGIHAEQLLFIPVQDNLEVWDVRVRNDSGWVRQLSIFSYAEFSYHHIEIDNQNLQMSLYASGSNYKDGIIEYDFFYEPWTFHYFASNFTPDSYDCLRDSFIGIYHSESDPVAVERGMCSGSSELGGNHCAALHKRFTLQPGEEKQFIFLLGVGSRQAAGYAMQKKYSDPTMVEVAFEELRQYWRRKQAIMQVRTPHQGMNTMLNTWTLLQAETCVVWSRFASFIEVGGRTGLGYRDTAQDVMSVVHTNPQKCEQRIRELLRGQVSQGYGLHLFDPAVFDPPENRLPGVRLPTVVPTPNPADIIHGLKDTCSDDHLWLIPTICQFVKESGDLGFFDQVIPFADDPLPTAKTGNSPTVYEHMRRALDFSAEQVGATGVCKGLRADWNDCLNLGGGESALVSFLHVWALNEFVQAARYLGRQEDAEKYAKLAENIKEVCNRELWDGEWYLRGFTRKGIKIGSKENNEGKIFLEHLPWVVIAGIATTERAFSTMDAVDRHLYCQYGLHLVWPAFTNPDDDIGYVTRVYPGIKENAAIFSHPNAWPIMAECLLGRGKRAMKFYDAILPYNQNDIIEIRQAEPYSYCQFIMGRDHTAHGRARHPWLTGTAGWMYTAATQNILGIRPQYDGLLVDPCIPAEWDGFEVTRQWRGATYHIQVFNPEHVEKGIKEVITKDATGRMNFIQGGVLPQMPVDTTTEVNVVMG